MLVTSLTQLPNTVLFFMPAHLGVLGSSCFVFMQVVFCSQLLEDNTQYWLQHSDPAGPGAISLALGLGHQNSPWSGQCALWILL